MKQLVLNFLFFVGAALIFIQCAKLFPSQSKLPKKQSKNVPANPGSTGMGLKASLFPPVNQATRPIFKPGSIISYFNNQAFPLNMMEYLKDYTFLNDNRAGFYAAGITGRSFFYYPYLNFGYTQLFNKNSGLQANNGPETK